MCALMARHCDGPDEALTRAEFAAKLRELDETALSRLLRRGRARPRRPTCRTRRGGRSRRARRARRARPPARARPRGVLAPVAALDAREVAVALTEEAAPRRGARARARAPPPAARLAAAGRRRHRRRRAARAAHAAARAAAAALIGLVLGADRGSCRPRRPRRRASAARRALRRRHRPRRRRRRRRRRPRRAAARARARGAARVASAAKRASWGSPRRQARDRGEGASWAREARAFVARAARRSGRARCAAAPRRLLGSRAALPPEPKRRTNCRRAGTGGFFSPGTQPGKMSRTWPGSAATCSCLCPRWP